MTIDDRVLIAISKWHHNNNWAGLMDYIRERWAYADAGYFRQDGRTYYLSTAGWSDNETIIDALSDNVVFWLMCWRWSKRGGHYKFKLPNPLDTEPRLEA
jgi:hypothetical protein